MVKVGIYLFEFSDVIDITLNGDIHFFDTRYNIIFRYRIKFNYVLDNFMQIIKRF